MHWLRRYPSLRRLHGVDTAKAVALCERHPVDSVLLRVAIEQTGIGASFSLGRFDADRELTALAWEYGNILPLGFDEDGLDEVAEEFAGRRRTGSSIVGPADQVMGLWNRICKRWGPARDVRERQFSMVMDSDPEVGYDPTSHGAGYAYRVARLVRSQHTFIRKAPLADGSGERVVFKADVGALAGGVAQLQGVWVAPDLRGRGIATAGVAAVVKLVRERLAPTISLYVNDYNAAAIATYPRVGFRIAGRWATVFV